VNRTVMVVWLAVGLLPVFSIRTIGAAPSSAAEIPAPNRKVQLHETVTNGFIHPGIGLTRAILENARDQVIARREPWYSYYRDLCRHPYSGLNVQARNQSRSNPALPDSDAFDSQGMEARFRMDGERALRQALMYYFTGNDGYRANAVRIIRVWSKMNPRKYKVYRDAHIHSGYPLKDMLTAAEIIRSAGNRNTASPWLTADTDNLTKNLITPVIATFLNQNGWFMNQNNFAIAGAMAGFIFINYRKGYEQRVEWFTVNRTAPNPGWNGAIRQLARLVDRDAVTGKKLPAPVVQLIEMGRDQAHSTEDVNLFVNISQMMMAQKTKVDPATGQVSTRTNAVGPYEFLGDRILAAADFLCRYMLGYETPWVPVAYDLDHGKVHAVYRRMAGGYRGRMTTFGFWPLYYYYVHVRKEDVAKKAPYFYEAFLKRINPGDWLYLPKEAAGEAARYIPPFDANAPVPVAARYTPLDRNSRKIQERENVLVRIAPSPDGAKLALLSAATESRKIALRIRTTGPATLKMDRLPRPWLLPNTNGQWRYVGYEFAPFEYLDNLVTLTVVGKPDATVDIAELIPRPDGNIALPEFPSGSGELDTVAYVGAPIELDLAASGPGKVICRSQNLPPGAVLNAASGRFAWRPTTAGIYSFLAEAIDGNAIAVKPVRITVAADRRAALRAATVAWKPEIEYRKAPLAAFQVLRRQTEEMLDTAPDTAFYPQLIKLKATADTLPPLTPLLPDGSIDYPGIVTSQLGKLVALLTDGNDDTAPAYTYGIHGEYCLDFGPDFTISADAFAMEGPLNFDNRMADSAVFGSNDRTHWTRLTPEMTGLTEDMTTLKVDPKLRHERFRFIQIRKVNHKHTPLFTLSELRIYGKRYER